MFNTFPLEIRSHVLHHHQPYLEIATEGGWHDARSRFQKERRFASGLCLVSRDSHAIVKPLLYSTLFVYVLQHDLVRNLPFVRKNHRWITRLIFWGEESPGGSFPKCSIGDILSHCDSIKTLELIDFHQVFDVHYSEGTDELARKFMSSITSTQLKTLSILTREEDPLEWEASEAPVTILQHLTDAVAGRIETINIDYWGSPNEELDRIPPQVFSSLRRLELFHIHLMEDYPCDFMKALTRPSVDSVVASIPPIRELHLGEVSQGFTDVFFTRILPTNNLGLGLRYLYFSIWQVDDSESLSPLPFLITQQCPHLEVLLYFVPCPVTFLDDLPVRLKRLGVLLSVMEDVGCKDGTPRLSPQSILGWANDSERRKGVEALVVGWDRCIWKAKERDRAEGEKRLQSGVKEVHISFSRFY